MAVLIEVSEESTLTMEIKVTDADGAEVTPTAAVWTLTDRDGNVQNGRSNVPITALSTAMRVDMAGDDLVISDQTQKREYRIFTVLTDRGDANKPETIETPFWIKNLEVIT